MQKCIFLNIREIFIHIFATHLILHVVLHIEFLHVVLYIGIFESINNESYIQSRYSISI